VASVNQGLKRFLVCLVAVALEYGVRVPLEFVPLERFQNRFTGTGLRSWWIDILDAE
jgi:hypothetical protein